MPRPRYQPGLDGLRAVAVIAVLLFHDGVSRAAGGFLGVSLFFTLSGYLITTLLLHEHAASGAISLTGFWSRRLRRLAPAALVTVGAVVISAPLWLDASQQRQLRGDAYASIFDVANWHYAFAGRAYADLFAAPSPLLHVWSLAIEEQFYLLLPLVLLVVLARRWAHPVRAVGVTAAVLFGSSVLAAVLTRDSTVAYYGTHTRAAELLAGVLLAVVLFRYPLASWPRAATRAATVCGLAGIVAFAALVMSLGTESVWLDHGGFAALSLVWVAIIVGAMTPGAPRALLGIGVLVAVGRISYGIYLLHWPLFLVLSHDRTGLDGVPLLALRLAVTVALAAALYRWVERPIRHPSEHRVRRRVGPRYALALTVVAALVIVVPLPNDHTVDVAEVPHTLVRFSDAAAATPPPQSSAPLRVVVIGSDPSVAMRLATAPPDLHVDVVNATDPHCPVFRDDVASACDDRASPAQMVQFQDGADVAVLALGAADRRVIPGMDLNQWRDIAARARLRLAAVVALGVPVVVTDAQPGGWTDADGNLVSEVMLHAPNATTTPTDPPNAELVATVVHAAHHSTDARTRVLVIGDSTSYAVARELDVQARDRLDVLWAGQDNCPLAASYQNSWWPGVTARTDQCPSVDSGWPDIIAKFDPSIVIAMDSVPELALQRFDAHDSWHTPGDSAWHTHLDTAIARLEALLAPTGATLYVADAPPITSGDMAGSPIASRTRIKAWNDVVAQWDAQSPSVVRLGIADGIVTIEREAGHSLRPDGVHLDDEGAARLVKEIVLPTVAP
jgi:peptidoglycan/LPS O-acetylase OafA/YrhL